MKKNKMLQYDLDLYSETLKNGLQINIVPKSNVNNIYVTFSTKYGSIHDEFIPINQGDYYKVPMGVAHFLEHKVFEEEDEGDPFTFFSSHGADANANTSSYKTTYLFSGPTNFEENLNYLLDFVQKPYFTDENVEKEKGIIAQELKMLSDMPEWELYDHALYNSFVVHPIKYPIGGTIETINKITKEDLYTCYNTFYHPANMFITITGNVQPKQVVDIIKKNQENKSFASFKPIIIKKYHEPDNVRLPYENLKFDVTIPKVALCYKFNKKNYDLNRLRIYLNLYFSLVLGSTSILNEELRDKNLITNSINFDVVNTDQHLLYILDFESDNYSEVLNCLKETIGQTKVSADELERKKKSLKSGCLYRSDNIFAINSRINNDIINYNSIQLDEFALIDSLSITELNEILKQMDFQQTSTIVMKNS